MQRKIEIVAMGSFLVVSACAVCLLYSAAIHRPVRDALVDEWLEIAFERRRLAGLDSTGVLITPEDYESELADLSVREQRIVFHNEFPAGAGELREFLLSRSTGPDLSRGVWLFLVGSSTVFVASVAWLHGYSAGKPQETTEETAVSDGG